LILHIEKYHGNIATLIRYPLKNIGVTSGINLRGVLCHIDLINDFVEIYL